MEQNSTNPSNKELEQSLKKMMIHSSPTKFLVASGFLIAIILFSIFFSKTLNGDNDHFFKEIDLKNIKAGRVEHTFNLGWCQAGEDAYVYLGEKEEFFDNHAAIRNSFDPDQISTFSLLSSKNYDCGPIRTFGDIAKFFNVKITDYMGNETFKTSNDVSLQFSSSDPTTLAYPCGFRALTIRSIPFQILDPNGEIVMLDTKDLTWNSNVKIFQDKTKVNWIRASHSHILNSLRTSPLGYGVKYMGKFKCEGISGANANYRLIIPEDFLNSNTMYPVYNLIGFHVKSQESLNKAPISYLIFSLINIVVIILVMVCIMCKKDKFFINPKIR